MSIYITKDGQKKKINVSATDVQLLDIDGRFKSKNLEDALKEVGSGTEENMTRIENKVEQLSNPNLFKNGNLNIWSMGTYFQNPQANYTADMWKQNTDLSSGTISIEKTDNGMKITISEDAVSNTHYLLSTIQDFDYSLNSDLVASIKFKQSKANMLNFFGKLSNDVIGEYQILTQTLTEIISNSFFWFDIVKTGEVEIEYIKLEQGNVATKNNVTTLNMDYAQCYPYHKNISQPNLLINGDFQVWQRGESFNGNTGSTYTVDRWAIAGDTYPKVEKIDNGVKITSTQNGTWTNFYTKLENVTLRKLIGKTLTYTVKLKTPTKINQIWCCTTSPSGQIYHHSKQYIDKNYEFLTGSFLVQESSYNADGFLEFGIQGVPQAGNSYEVEWAKLELGSVATPFVPRPYAEELALCQRYCQKFSAQGVVIANNNLSVQQSYPVTMRTKPTVKLVGNSLFCSETCSNVVFSILSYNAQNDYLQNLVSSDTNLVANRHYAGSYFLDAEIY